MGKMAQKLKALDKKNLTTRLDPWNPCTCGRRELTAQNCPPMPHMCHGMPPPPKNNKILKI